MKDAGPRERKTTFGSFFRCLSLSENLLHEKENQRNKNIKDSLARNNRATSINQLNHCPCKPSCVCIKGLLCTRIVL